MNGEAITRKAVFAALKARMDAGIPNDMPICPLDFAGERGVDVRFMAVPSMEGAYHRASETIIVSSLRPRGRRAFTGAHEYGHHHFGHASCVDELEKTQKTPRPVVEVLADRFAGALLMPRPAVVRGFRNIGVQPEDCTPEQAYRISCWLGVSYEAFLLHASRAVRVMPAARADALQRSAPKSVKLSLATFDPGGDLVVADENWRHAIDLQIGDVLMLPAGAETDGVCTEAIQATSEASYFHATSVGLDRAYRDAWSGSIRVSRPGYEGLARYRHFPEDPND